MWKQTINRGLLVIVLFGMVGLFVLPRHTSAAAGINQQMAFQGKVVLANGTNIPDGTYNVEFKIYDGGTSTGGGTLKWTEDRLIGGTGGVVVTSGTFTVNLGSANAFGGSVDWNSDTLWLSLQVGNTSSCTITTTFTADCAGDGEMTPYIRLTAVPYAFNALQLGGVAASGYGQLANNQSWTGINTFSLTGGKAVALTGAPINTATVSLLQLGNAIAGGNTSVNGGTYIGINAPGSGAGSAADFLNLQNNSVTQFRVDSAGNATAAGTVQAANINAVTAYKLNGVNITTGGTLSNFAYLDQSNTFTGATNTFSATGGNSVAITGAPINNATLSLLRLGGAISGGNTTANGGTYFGINLPASGAGSVADILNFQNNGTVELKLTSGGALTIAGAITAPTATNTINGLIVNSGVLSGITGFTMNSGTFNVTGTSGFTGSTTINTGTASSLAVSSGANVPTVDQLTVTNNGSTGVTVANINGLSIAYKGGAAAVEAAAQRIDLTPGSTSGGTWSALRVVGSTAASGVNEYALKVESITGGAGNESAINVGTGWDNILQSSNITVSQGGAITSSGLATLTGGANITGDLTVNTGTANKLSVTSGASVPTVDQVVIDNTTSTGVVTAGVNGANIKYRGGAAAVESAGMRIDFIPGTTSGGVWSGMRIVADATGAAAGVNAYGIKLEGPTTPGTGTENAVYVGTGWDIGVDIQSGGMQLAAQSDPAAPAAGNLRIYAKDIAGRVMPKWVGPSGVDTPFQANLGFNRVALSTPTGTANCSTGATGLGSTSTGAGTCTVPVLAATNLLTSVRRLSFSTGATAGTVTYQRQSQLQVWRGNAAGRGGFFYTVRFGLSTLAAGNRAFVGLSSSIANPTNVDPLTSPTIGRVGVAINLNTGNWNFVTNAVGAVPTVTPLGATMPVNNTDLYELVLHSAPNGTVIGWRVTNISTGAQVSGSAAANIPTNTTFLAPQFWLTNNATAAAAILDFSSWYLESDN